MCLDLGANLYKQKDGHKCNKICSAQRRSNELSPHVTQAVDEAACQWRTSSMPCRWSA